MEVEESKPCNKGGYSKYPIVEGNIFRLHKPRMMLNRKINAHLNHTVFIWIQVMWKKRAEWKTQPKELPITVGLFFVPQMAGGRRLLIVRQEKWQKETISKYLREGFDLLPDTAKFYYRKYNWRAAYRAAQLL